MGQEVLLSKESGQQPHKPWSVGDSAASSLVPAATVLCRLSRASFVRACAARVWTGQHWQHSLMQDSCGQGAPGHAGVGLPQLTQEGSLKEIVLSQAPAGYALVSHFD